MFNGTQFTKILSLCLSVSVSNARAHTHTLPHPNFSLSAISHRLSHKPTQKPSPTSLTVVQTIYQMENLASNFSPSLPFCHARGTRPCQTGTRSRGNVTVSLFIRSPSSASTHTSIQSLALSAELSSNRVGLCEWGCPPLSQD